MSVIINGLNNSTITVGGNFHLGDTIQQKPLFDKEYIREKVAKSQLDKALDGLGSLLAQNGERELTNAYIMLSQQFKKLRSDENLAMISYDTS